MCIEWKCDIDFYCLQPECFHYSKHCRLRQSRNQALIAIASQIISSYLQLSQYLSFSFLTMFMKTSKNRRKSQTILQTFQDPKTLQLTPGFTATTNIKSLFVPFLIHLSFFGTESKQGSLQFGVIRCITIFLQVEQHILAALLVEWNCVLKVVLRLQEKTRRVFHFETVEFLHHFIMVEQRGLRTQRFLNFGLSSHFACSNGVVSDGLESLASRCLSFGFLSRGRRATEIVNDLEGITRRLICALGLHLQQIILIKIFRVVICTCQKQRISVSLNNKCHKKPLAVSKNLKTICIG